MATRIDASMTTRTRKGARDMNTKSQCESNKTHSPTWPSLKGVTTPPATQRWGRDRVQPRWKPVGPWALTQTDEARKTRALAVWAAKPWEQAEVSTRREGRTEREPQDSGDARHAR